MGGGNVQRTLHHPMLAAMPVNLQQAAQPGSLTNFELDLVELLLQDGIALRGILALPKLQRSVVCDTFSACSLLTCSTLDMQASWCTHVLKGVAQLGGLGAYCPGREDQSVGRRAALVVRAQAVGKVLRLCREPDVCGIRIVRWVRWEERILVV